MLVSGSRWVPEASLRLASLPVLTQTAGGKNHLIFSVVKLKQFRHILDNFELQAHFSVSSFLLHTRIGMTAQSMAEETFAGVLNPMVGGEGYKQVATSGANYGDRPSFVKYYIIIIIIVSISTACVLSCFMYIHSTASLKIITSYFFFFAVLCCCSTYPKMDIFKCSFVRFSLLSGVVK